MNTIEKALRHVLFVHLHRNIDKAIDFEAIDALNRKAMIPNKPSAADLEVLQKV